MPGNATYPLLDRVMNPHELRALPESALPAVADELRTFLINTVSQMGGHFAAGLGTVELTVALHYVFETPNDRLVWDVGHQAYPHKVLTGRGDRLATIKQKDGLAPFPSRTESEYDTFGVGHSSTSVSAALGMALADRLQGGHRAHVAVIGDGAMSAGLAFEALNHAGAVDANVLVVLNDNDMSISENVGALSNYFARVLAGRLYQGIREGGKRVLRRIPAAWEFARRSEEHLKGMVLPGTMFEEMGLNYIGPVDGHDVVGLVRTLKLIKQARGPQFLHVVTKKGKGYAPAEADPIKWHGPGPFDAAKGEIRKEQASGPTYTQVFSQWLCDEADRDPTVVAITPAMREGSGLVEFSKRFPNRYFDVAIAEQHAVTLAAGMACEGLKPVVAIYSSFLQRGYDQLIHDVAIQNLPVTFALDRAGLVGGDGATHQGTFDLSYLRCIPNLTVMVPADENECRQMLHTAVHLGSPAAVRYPRGTGPGAKIVQELYSLPIGKGVVVRRGRSRLAIVALGPMVSLLGTVAEEFDATLVNLRFVKPLDRELVLDIATHHSHLVTAEENVLQGGAGSAILEVLAEAGLERPVLRLGIPDQFIEHGSRNDNLVSAGLDVGTMRSRIAAFTSHHSQRV